MATYNPADAAGIIDDINNNATNNGDIVNLPDGTFDCTASTLAPTPGVTIRGNAMRRCVINAGWNMDLGGSANTLILQDFTADGAGVAKITSFGPFEFFDGSLNAERVRWTNADQATSNCLTFKNTGFPVIANLTDCQVDTCTADVISTVGDGGADAGNSALSLFNCTVFGQGDSTAHQAVTAHDDFGIWIIGGDYRNTSATAWYVMSPAGARIHIFGAYIEGSVLVYWTQHCTIEGGVTRNAAWAASENGSTCLANRIIVNKATAPNYGAISGAFTNVRFESNWISGSATAAQQSGAISLIQTAGPHHVYNNRLTDNDVGLHVEVDTGTSPTGTSTTTSLTRMP